MKKDSPAQPKSSRLSKFTRVVAAVVAAASLSMLATPAFAGPEFGGEVEAGGDGGGSSGGGTGTPPSSPKPPTNPQPPRVYANVLLRGSTPNCGATSIGYQNRYRSLKSEFPTSAALSDYVIQNLASGAPSPAYVERLGVTCLYPPSHRDVTYRVVLDANLKIDKVVPESKTMRSVSVSTRYGKGERSLAAVKASNQAKANSSVNIQEFGRYELTGVARARMVTVRQYSRHTDALGGTYTDHIVSSGPIFNASVANAKGEFTCQDGWRNGWTSRNWSWSHVDCGPNTDTPIYQCRADSGPAVTVNGQSTRNVTLPRSGEAVAVRFAAVRPTLSNLGAERTRWTRSGTPWRTNGVSVKDAMVQLSVKPGGAQLFTSDSATAWNKGTISNLYLSSNWASDEGKPTRITPSYSFQGTASIKSVTITGVNSNGSWSTKPTTSNVRALAVCAGTPLTASFMRSVQGTAG